MPQVYLIPHEHQYSPVAFIRQKRYLIVFPKAPFHQRIIGDYQEIAPVFHVSCSLRPPPAYSVNQKQSRQTVILNTSARLCEFT